MSFSSRERERLADLLRDKGPDTPTLCGGWTTRDLAAHLWLRENRPDAAAGMFVSLLSGHLESVMEDAKARDYDALVDAWASGPGKLNPWRYLDSQANFAEHFVHHEDVLRGDGKARPRDFSRAVNDKFCETLSVAGKLFLRKSTKPVILQPEGRKPIVTADKRGVAERGDDVVRVSGEPGELLLWAFGRDAVDVTIEGDEGAVHRSDL